jgi:hypothetical protein
MFTFAMCTHLIAHIFSIIYLICVYSTYLPLSDTVTGDVVWLGGVTDTVSGVARSGDDTAPDATSGDVTMTDATSGDVTMLAALELSTPIFCVDA